VNAILCIFLCLQAIIFTFSALRMELPVPQSLYPRIEAKLKDSGITGEWETLSFDLLAGLRVNNLKIKRPNQTSLASADQVFVKINQKALLCGKLQLDRIRVSNLTIYNCPIFSADGTASPLIHHVNADIYANGDTLQINHAIGKLKNLSISLTGHVYLEQRAKTNTDIPQAHLQLCKQVEEALNKLPQLDSPIVELAFDISNTGINTLSGRIETKSATLPQGNLKNISLEFDQLDLRQSQLKGNLRLRAEKAQWNSISANRIRFFAQNLSFDSNNLPIWKFAAIRASNVSYEDLEIEAPILRLPGNQNSNRIEGTLAASFQKDFFSIHGIMPEGLQGRSTFKVKADVHLTNLWDKNPLNKYNIGTILKSDATQKIATTLDFEPGLRFKKARFTTFLRDLTAHDAHFRYIEARGQADKSGLLVDDVFVRNPGCEASGIYQHIWKTLDYRMFIQGHIFPQDLNPLFEGWWDGLWEKIQPTTTPYVGDVEVSGNWKQKEGSTFLSAHAQNFHSEQGTFIPDVSLKLWYRDHTLRGYDVKLTPEKGYITGNLELYMFPDDFPKKNTLVLDLHGNSTLDFLNTELYLKLDKLFSHLHPTDIIQSDILANVLLSEDDSQEIAASFSIKADQPVVIHDVSFKSIRLNGLYKDRKTQLNNIEARLENGAVYGSYYMDSTKTKEPLMQLQGEVHNTRISNLYKILQLKESENNNIQGTLNGHIKLEGIPGKVDTYSGKGHASLSETELGKIRTFGIISRIFESIKLPLGVFDLNEATSDFVITNGLVETPNMSITGPNTTVEANGTYNIKNQQIQYNLKCFLLRPPKDSIVSLFGMILTPLGHFMELDVTGTLNEPKWKFSNKLNPLQIF
jgi:hypothetical protein